MTTSGADRGVHPAARAGDGQEQAQPKRSASVEPKPADSRYSATCPNMTPEEHLRAGDLAHQLFGGIVRRAADDSRE
jgi:hypothetical protein